MKQQIKFTTHKNQYSVLIFIFLVGVLLLGLVQTSTAQVIKPKPTPPVAKKTVVFKGKGVKLSRVSDSTTTKRVSLSAPLTMAQKRTLLVQAMTDEGEPAPDATVTSYVRLNPRTPYVENKGFVDFNGALFVNPSEGQAYFSGGADQKVTVGVKPARAGQWFLVECWVSARSGPPFRITGPGGIVTEIPGPPPTDAPGGFSGLAATLNLQAFVSAGDTDWQLLTITRASLWSFWSCEVTAMN